MFFRICFSFFGGKQKNKKRFTSVAASEIWPENQNPPNTARVKGIFDGLPFRKPWYHPDESWPTSVVQET